MNKHIILVSKKPIVIQIFRLVCNKLDIDLDIIKEPIIDKKVDIIVMDTDFTDERFNTAKINAKLMGAISKVELPFEIANDFIIPIPFLPSNLEDILQKQFSVIKERENSKIYIKNADQLEAELDDEDIDELDASLDYIDDLASDISDELNTHSNNEDESIVKIEDEADGGILDKSQLDEIGSLLETPSVSEDRFIEANPKEDENWQDLSSIIDQAINEVNTVEAIEAQEKKIIDVKLNDYHLEQLTPLLNLLDQDVIDLLTKGEDIKLNLRFENEDK